MATATTRVSVGPVHPDESTYARELPPLAVHHSPFVSRRCGGFTTRPREGPVFRQRTTEAAGIYNPAGFNADTRVLFGTSEPRSLTARMLTIADVYEALTTARSYRAAFNHSAALDIMRSECGTTFDPALLERFLEMMSEHRPTRAAPADPCTAVAPAALVRIA